MISFSPFMQGQDPVFTPFEGVVYKMPVERFKTKHGTKIGVKEYYHPEVYDYKILEDAFTMESISVYDRESKEGFPGLEHLKSQFAMVLHSQLTISEAACYEFSLNSDDGSILWLNEQIVVNNDGGHKMSLKKDSMNLEPGTYNAKLWYFQSYPTRFGIELRVEHVGPTSVCLDKELESSIMSLTLESALLFDVDEYELSDEGEDKILSFLADLEGRRPSVISIVGHTDSTGSSEYNQLLSLKRAISVADLMKRKFPMGETRYVVMGKGDSDPVVENLGINERQKNRRVVVQIDF